MKKNINSEYARNFIILYRWLCMDSGAHNLTSTNRHDILSTVISSGLNCAYNRRYKIDKINMHVSNLISTESSAKFLDTKFLPELSFYLKMLQ